jgi:uncharacterized protein (DUF1501 family)
MTTLSRRELLAAGAAAGAVGAAALTIGTKPATAAGAAQAVSPSVDPSAPPELVVVQLGGGNDALNTLVPDAGLYIDNRPNLKLDFASCVPVPGAAGYGLHPSLAPLTPMLGNLAIVAGLGMPGQDRSHFRAFDYWWSANATSPVQTGWLGRWLDATRGQGSSPLRAVSLRGGSVAFRHPNVPTITIVDPRRFKPATPKGGKGDQLRAAWAGGAPGSSGLAAQLWASHQTADQAMSAVQSVLASVPAGTAFNTAAGNMAFAAELIIANPTVRVIQVPAAGSLDTHAAQLTPHANIWSDIAGGLAAMYDRLAAAGHAGRVLTITVSEFGRRVKENASLGCDHGKAGVQFALGPMVTGGLINGWDLASLDQGDLPIVDDARRLYATALAWLGGPVDSVLGGAYAALPVV